jgi:DNA-binding protein H-NS
MATYSELISQISELKKQAEKQRKEEYSVVLRSIKKQIQDYGITADELGFAPGSIASSTTKPSSTYKKHKKSSGKKVAPKYQDTSGNTWSGRGKRPRWVTAAIDSGVSLDTLLIRTDSSS